MSASSRMPFAISVISRSRWTMALSFEVKVRDCWRAERE